MSYLPKKTGKSTKIKVEKSSNPPQSNFFEALIKPQHKNIQIEGKKLNTMDK